MEAENLKGIPGHCSKTVLHTYPGGVETLPIYPAIPTQSCTPPKAVHQTLQLCTPHAPPSIPPALRDSAQKSDTCTTPGCVIAGELRPLGGHKAILGLPEAMLRFLT